MTEITIRDALQTGLREALEEDDDVIIMASRADRGGIYGVRRREQ